MSSGAIRFDVNLESEAEAEAIARAVRERGGSAEFSERPGFLPLPVLILIALPPGIALLAQVINRIILEWTRHGVLIDARGGGPPRLSNEPDLPYGSVVILTRDGDQVHRSDLPAESVADYIAKAIEALSGGVSAGEADTAAASALSG